MYVRMDPLDCSLYDFCNNYHRRARVSLIITARDCYCFFDLPSFAFFCSFLGLFVPLLLIFAFSFLGYTLGRFQPPAVGACRHCLSRWFYLGFFLLVSPSPSLLLVLMEKFVFPAACENGRSIVDQAPVLVEIVLKTFADLGNCNRCLVCNLVCLFVSPCVYQCRVGLARSRCVRGFSHVFIVSTIAFYSQRKSIHILPCY